MPRNSILFEHPRTGETKQASVGFCWRLVQFGALFPAYQRQWLLFLAVLAGALLTFSVSNVVLAFFYNKLYIKTLLAGGFLARSTQHGSLEQVEMLLGLSLPRHTRPIANTD